MSNQGACAKCHHLYSDHDTTGMFGTVCHGKAMPWDEQPMKSAACKCEGYVPMEAKKP
jgi:hypothetical protein